MNLFKRFERLLPQNPLRVADVISVDGTNVLVEEIGGARFQFRGTATPGTRVYVRNQVIEGPAPDLPLEVIEE